MSGIIGMLLGAAGGLPPVNTAVPVISGSATLGSTLSCSTGTWTGDPTPTYTYQWQKNTSNISGATSSTYVVDLSNAGSTIRCVVTATNSRGVASANSASTGTVPVPAIGTATGGGYYAGAISTTGNGIADFYLIVSPKASGQSSPAPFGPIANDPGATSVINGPANSASMDDIYHSAARFCETRTIGGYTDWYLPAKNELEVLYYNLKPTYDNNSTTSGANTNAVPSRPSNYTASVPAQTSVTAFREGNSEAFYYILQYRYWSSTQSNETYAWAQYFQNGNQNIANKDNTTNYFARAIRRVAV